MTIEQGMGFAVAIIIPLAGFHWRTWVKQDRYMKKIDKLIFGRLAVEHETLIQDYCERRNIELRDLPTRHNGVL